MVVSFLLYIHLWLGKWSYLTLWLTFFRWVETNSPSLQKITSFAVSPINLLCAPCLLRTDHIYLLLATKKPPKIVPENKLWKRLIPVFFIHRHFVGYIYIFYWYYWYLYIKYLYTYIYIPHTVHFFWFPGAFTITSPSLHPEVDVETYELPRAFRDVRCTRAELQGDPKRWKVADGWWTYMAMLLWKT